MPKEASIIKEEVRDKDGNIVVNRDLNPRELPQGVNMSGPRSLAGSVAANEVLKNGGSVQDALDAAIKARNAEKEQAQVPSTQIGEGNPELEDMIRYIHAIARLHSGRFEDLTPQGLFEVAMLCPYQVEDFETWRAKMEVLRGNNG